MKHALTLSLPLAALVALVSYVGLTTPDFYSLETANWQAQAVGQDIADLFLVTPVLLITAFLASRRNSIGTLLWGGTLLYLIYTFIIYNFAIHCNSMFVFYCLALGLSFYSFLYFITSLVTEHVGNSLKNTTIIKTTGIYFLILPALFYFLWLSEVVPAVVSGTIPKSLIETGLFTNPVHVIDLSIFLPGIFITGLLILKRKPLGLLLTPVLLTFFVLMDITLAGLIIIMNQRGVEQSYEVAIVMSIFALISFVLLVWYIKSTKNK